MKSPAPLAAAVFFASLAAAHAAERFPGTPDNFNGVTRFTVPIGAQPALVLCPTNAAPGKPWVLVQSLYSLSNAAVANMTRAELELVGRGFHVVAFDLGNTFGAPDALARWDAVYDEMTTRYGLGKRVSLMGVSREGLAIARWAAAHPGRVPCLYMDKAVCDFKSWPGGKLGISKGSPPDWESLIRLYHFKSEAEAMAYDQNPKDLAPKLAADGVAIVYVTGAKDDAVPYAENGARMEEVYQKSGGTFQLFRRDNEGHHPHGLADPTPIVDLIERTTTGGRDDHRK
jgi:pimeloyl-ACP methyl ester carboxylesterase